MLKTPVTEKCELPENQYYTMEQSRPTPVTDKKQKKRSRRLAQPPGALFLR